MLCRTINGLETEIKRRSTVGCVGEFADIFKNVLQTTIQTDVYNSNQIGHTLPNTGALMNIHNMQAVCSASGGEAKIIVTQTAEPQPSLMSGYRTHGMLSTMFNDGGIMDLSMFARTGVKRNVEIPFYKTAESKIVSDAGVINQIKSVIKKNIGL